MNVWNFEAADIIDSNDLDSCPIFSTPEIKEFLTGERSTKRIISGLKGTGKTLFLKLISHHYRRLGGVTLVPATELTERLYSIDFDFSSSKARSWASQERWKHVWRTVLSVVILRAVGYELPNEILKIFPNTLGISIAAHLSEALRCREVDVQKFQEGFPILLDTPIQNINQPVALFVDNIDEALARHVGKDLFLDSVDRQSQSGQHAYELWLSAQIGFMDAVRELSTRNAHLKLFGTVRSEAVRDNCEPTAFNLLSIVLDLRYSEAEFRGIFETKLKRLREIAPDSFSRKDEEDPIKAFFPFDSIKHNIIPNLNEDVFDYIRRHTRGRPRELDFIGQDLFRIPPKDRTEDCVREIVRNRSAQFFRFAKNEAVPFWDPKLDDLINLLSTNFIQKNRAISIAKRVFGVENGTWPWIELQKNGLCGAVVNDHPNVMEQRFSTHDSLSDLSKEDFLHAQTWVIHPSVTIDARPRRKKYLPDQANVAGHMYPYRRKKENTRKHIHVLIGAGKLGFGLVTPMLLSDKKTNILIVARHSESWQELLDSQENCKTLRIKYTQQDEQKIPLEVISDQQEEWKIKTKGLIKNNRCVVLIIRDTQSIAFALSLGTSLGFSVGSNSIENIANQIADYQYHAKYIIGYENDFQKISLVKEKFHEKGKILVTTVVDRICSEREISSQGVVISAERYGKITAFVAPNTKFCNLLPNAFESKENKDLRIVTDIASFEYLCEKKKRLVNTLHTTAAVLVHKALKKIKAKDATYNENLLALVANGMDNREQLELFIDLLVLSVLGTLSLDEFSDVEVRAKITDLIDYGKLAMSRILNALDSPSRVLMLDIKTLSTKYQRLYSDVKELALKALQNRTVYSVFQLTQREIDARLNIVNEFFVDEFSHIVTT